ncbi:MAG: flagellar biosynthesis protein FlhB [Oxalobacteraceae bacterium]|jgi:flagellar biosynthetic protein FlhB|nr:flagellar biosynthesis protein FlhB [Oxalobacteraceae bacterium]
MSESSEEKTEEPTSRRLQKAREEGQVARSQELPAAAITIAALSMILITGGMLISKLSEAFSSGFNFDRKLVHSSNLLPAIFAHELLESYLLIAPLLLLTAAVAIASSGATGGFLFEMGAVAPKFSKLNPMNGFKRMFGMKAAVELGKALLKFTLVSGAVAWVLMDNVGTLNKIGRMALEPGMLIAGEMLTRSSLIMACALVVIALIDVPFQRWQFMKQMRMTKQEIKDEMKDMEGRPEIKAQIRRRQREMSNARMMDKVKDADVVITNPEHFAVALAYDPNGDSAPILLAKGADAIAARIREEAKKHGVEIFQAAPLARALYFTTEVNHPVPEDLYYAVAQVIAYVFNLASIRPGAAPVQRPQPTLPPNMLFDADGRLETEEAVN